MKEVFSLSDRAIVMYFAIREFGPMSNTDMAKLLNKSLASMHRAKRELTQAGILKSRSVLVSELSIA